MSYVLLNFRPKLVSVMSSNVVFDWEKIKKLLFESFDKFCQEKKIKKLKTLVDGYELELKEALQPSSSSVSRKRPRSSTESSENPRALVENMKKDFEKMKKDFEKTTKEFEDFKRKFEENIRKLEEMI